MAAIFPSSTTTVTVGLRLELDDATKRYLTDAGWTPPGAATKNTTPADCVPVAQYNAALDSVQDALQSSHNLASKFQGQRHKDELNRLREEHKVALQELRNQHAKELAALQKLEEQHRRDLLGQQHRELIEERRRVRAGVAEEIAQHLESITTWTFGASLNPWADLARQHGQEPAAAAKITWSTSCTVCGHFVRDHGKSRAGCPWCNCVHEHSNP